MVDRCHPGPPGRGELRLLSVGRLEREKGHTFLLDAVARLRDRGTAVQLELVGDGTLMECFSDRRASSESRIG